MQNRQPLSFRKIYLIDVLTMAGAAVAVCLLLANTDISPGILAAVLIAVIAAVQVALYFVFIRPVFRIQRLIEAYTSNSAEELLGLIGQDSTNSRIMQGFRAMIEKMNDLLISETNLELSRRHAQLDALQQQINPHFLYNTLDTIRGQAHLAEQPAIEGMALSLSKLFRYSISSYSDLVPLRDELEVIESYMFIQNTRFSNKFSLFFEIDEDCVMERIPKMTIQPLVENAIHHGLEPKIDPGTIVIKAHRTQTHIMIDIDDDGIGIDYDRLDQLNSILHDTNTPIIKKDSSHSIGLYNINSRIRLLYGADASMTIYSVPDTGTDIRISLPLQ